MLKLSPLSEPSRICPQCAAPTSIAAEEKVWPRGWACAACKYEAPCQDDIVLTAPELADTISGFDPADFAFLSEAELQHFWFSARRELIVSLADKYAGHARSCLEVGCGSGNVINALARARDWSRIVGTEIHPSGLAHASPRLPANVELLQADARSLPFARAFDLIGAFDVLEHIAEDELVLSQIQQALLPDGIFLATVPQHPWLWSLADEVAYHKRRYRRGELEGKLSSAGFNVLFSTSYTAVLLPLMVLSRLMSRKKADGAQAREIVRKEFEISPVINGALRAFLGAETALTRRGVSWPFGGSRVIVAQKRRD